MLSQQEALPASMDGSALHRSAHRVGPVATATGSTETPSARCFSSLSSSSLRLPPPAYDVVPVTPLDTL